MAKSHSPVETMLSVINFFGPEGFRYPVAENSGTVVTYLAAAILAKYQPFYCLSECHCRSCIQKLYVVLVTDYSSCWTFLHVWVLVIILVCFCFGVVCFFVVLAWWSSSWLHCLIAMLVLIAGVSNPFHHL